MQKKKALLAAVAESARASLAGAPEASTRSRFAARPLTFHHYGTIPISATDCLIRSDFFFPLGSCHKGLKCFKDRIIRNPGSGGQSLSLPTQEPSPTLLPAVATALL